MCTLHRRRFFSWSRPNINSKMSNCCAALRSKHNMQPKQCGLQQYASRHLATGLPLPERQAGTAYKPSAQPIPLPPTPRLCMSLPPLIILLVGFQRVKFASINFYKTPCAVSCLCNCAVQNIPFRPATAAWNLFTVWSNELKCLSIYNPGFSTVQVSGSAVSRWCWCRSWQAVWGMLKVRNKQQQQSRTAPSNKMCRLRVLRFFKSSRI